MIRLLHGTASAFLMAILLFGFSAHQAWAEPVTQSIPLTPGWNAIYLEVQPPDSDIAIVFSDLISAGHLESVWAWDPDTPAGTFLTDPLNEPALTGINMLGYYPAPPVPDPSNLFAVHGGNAYLVHINDTYSGPPLALTITGEPSLPRGDWKQNTYNFTGFPIETGNEPFFANFFSSDPALDGQKIFLLRETSPGVFEWQPATATDVMQQGQSFWIYCNGFSNFTGPMHVDPPMAAGLDYADKLTELPLVIGNPGSVDLTISITPVSTATLPELYFYDYTIQDWDVIGTGTSFTVNPKDTLELRIGVRRDGLAAGVDRTANLELRGSGAGIGFGLVPLTVTGIDRRGLWVGEVSIDQVNRPGTTSTLNPDPALEPTSSMFTFPLIIHNDGTNVSLLREALLVRNKYTYEPEIHTSAPTDWAGIALRDGVPVGRRVSSAAFGFDGAHVLGSGFDTAVPPAQTGTGAFAEGQTLAATLVVEKYDPDTGTGSKVHPYQHRMHPRGGMLPGESFTITRAISLIFDPPLADPASGVSTLAWGATVMGGTYQETIYGLQRNPVKVEGRFVLRRASGVATLKP